MPDKIVYVHYDKVGNNVLSNGIVNQNRHILLKRTPQNLLLLSNPMNTGVYDHHTGFRMINGQEAVKQFLQSGIGKPSQLGSWIDFSSVEMLHQLTPVEISEILYLGHAHNYLHSPFYYKMQNNYIYLSLPNNFTKVYYRYLDEFLDQFAESITNRMQATVQEKKRLFQKEQIVAPFEIENHEELIPMFREGVCLSFRQVTKRDETIHVPIFICEDRLSHLEQPFEEDDQIGTLRYSLPTRKWELELDYE